MGTILLPTDFSANANNALNYAVEIAELTGTSLQLLHVYTPMVPPNSVIRALITDEVLDAKKENLEKLIVQSNTIKSMYPKLQVAIRSEVGETVSTILSCANEIKPELIIMGTLGVSNITRMIFGSNTAAVVSQSSFPVLCIPSECSFQLPKRILFATTFSFDDMKGITRLATLAKLFKSEILVGHVDTSSSEEPNDSSMKKFVQEIKLLTDYVNISSCVVSDHNVSMGLEQIISKNDINMLALSTFKRTFFEKFYKPSLAKKMVLYPMLPIIVFQNPRDEEGTGSDF